MEVSCGLGGWEAEPEKMPPTHSYRDFPSSDTFWWLCSFYFIDWLFLDALPLHSAMMNHLGLQSSMHEKDCEIERQSEKTQPVRLWGLQKWRTGWGLKKRAEDPRALGEVPGWSLLGKPLCFWCKHSCVVTYTLPLLRQEMNSELLRMLQVT